MLHMHYAYMACGWDEHTDNISIEVVGFFDVGSEYEGIRMAMDQLARSLKTIPLQTVRSMTLSATIVEYEWLIYLVFVGKGFAHAGSHQKSSAFPQEL